LQPCRTPPHPHTTKTKKKNKPQPPPQPNPTPPPPPPTGARWTLSIRIRRSRKRVRRRIDASPRGCSPATGGERIPDGVVAYQGGQSPLGLRPIEERYDDGAEAARNLAVPMGPEVFSRRASQWRNVLDPPKTKEGPSSPTGSHACRRVARVSGRNDDTPRSITGFGGRWRIESCVGEPVARYLYKLMA